MQYKTIVLELLQQQTQLHEQLRQNRRLMPAMEALARELKASHDEWKESISQARPGSEPSQIAAEAMELAVKELRDRLQSASPDSEDFNLDAAMASLRNPTSRG